MDDGDLLDRLLAKERRLAWLSWLVALVESLQDLVVEDVLQLERLHDERVRRLAVMPAACGLTARRRLA